MTSTRPGAERDWIPYRHDGADRRGRAGCGLAALLAALGFVGVVGIALAAIAFRGGSGPVERDVSDLRVGDCLVQPGGESQYLFELVGCDHPHDDEVVAAGRLDETGASPYPPLADLRGRIEQICVGDAFTRYVGVVAAATALHVLFITPDEQAWRDARGPYACVVDGGGERLEGSVRGSGR